MTIRLDGLQVVLTAFKDIERAATHAANKELERAAKEIAALARDYAPVDRGDLVRSIRAQRMKSGLNTVGWRVKVGGRQGERDVNQYALLVHERFTTTKGGQTRQTEWFNPGKKSQAKARALGVPVGGQFLTRAFRKLRPKVEENLRQALGEEIRRIVRKNPKRGSKK